MTNLEWLKGVIEKTNFGRIEWMKNLPEEELIKRLMKVYNKDWLMKEHKKKYRVNWTIHYGGHYDVEADTPDEAILRAKLRMLDKIADDVAQKADFSAEELEG